MSRVHRSLAVLVTVLVALSGCAQLADRLQDVTNTVNPDRGSGSHHEKLLAGDTDTLLLEISHSQGAMWDSDTRAERDVKQQLARITDKQIRVTSSQDLPSKGEDYRYSSEELRSYHEEYQDREDTEDRVVMHGLFLDGKYERQNTAGLAFAGSGFALFKGEIRDVTCSNDALVCDGVREWKVTRAVTIHEAGHLFGLVDCPLPMVEDHEMDQDPNPDTQQNEGKCHSENNDSVMFWKVERSGGLEDLIGGGDVPWEFDSDDVQDARAIQ